MEKPIKKLHGNGHDWEVNEAWIRSQIAKISNLEDTREIVKTIAKDNYTKEQTIFFSLEGSPARGFAIYAKPRLCIIPYGLEGKKKIFNEIVIKDNDIEPGM